MHINMEKLLQFSYPYGYKFKNSVWQLCLTSFLLEQYALVRLKHDMDVNTEVLVYINSEYLFARPLTVLHQY